MAENVHDKTMPHLLEVLKIVEGAVNADRSKVVSYTEQLASKIEADGDPKAADRLRKVLAQSKFREVTASKLGTSRLPVDSESRLALADEQMYKPEEVKVFLAAEVKATTTEFVRFVQSAESLIKHGVGISPTLIMHGPPGCGKTELSHYIAAQLGLPLITARSDALVSSFLGSTAKNLRTLFEHAMDRPCVLFLDEFDSLAKLRDDKHELGELKRVVVSLLQNIDAMDNQTVLLAATNHEHLLDPAIWRRFAFKVRMDKPGDAARKAMFHHYLGSFATQDVIELCSALTHGSTGGEIKQLCDDSKRAAVLAFSEQVDLGDLLQRIVRIRLPQLTEEMPLAERLRTVRELDPKIFSYRRLKDVFGVSIGYISKLLGEPIDE